jgi:HK97 family phage portal protein
MATPLLVSRLASALVGSRPPRRVLHLNEESNELEHHGIDLLGQRYETGEQRREQRTAMQITTSYAAVWAAVRWREQAIGKPLIHAQRRVGTEWEELKSHPALDALHRVNDTLTAAQGLGLIERSKLTYGEAIWVKRRDALGVVREWDVWPAAGVRPIPDPERPGRALGFERSNHNGTVTRVSREEVVWFRHAIHPLDLLTSLTPIGAIRVMADTALEAGRHNQRLFDNGIALGGTISGDFGPSERDRVVQELKAEWKGTDNAGRWHVIEGEGITVTPLSMTNRDMEWAEVMGWGVQEVARAFELSPIALKDFSRATYANADQALTEDWTTVATSLQSILAEYNEQCVAPDFGEDFRIVADLSNIPALQADLKKRAEIDEIELRSGKRAINELRARDGEAAIEGGDTTALTDRIEAVGGLIRAGFEPAAALEVAGLPQVEHLGMPPVTIQSTARPVGAAGGGEGDGDNPRAGDHHPPPMVTRAVPSTPSTADQPGLLERERESAELWENILGREMRAIIAHLEAEDAVRRQRDIGAVDSYDWDWQRRYSRQIVRDLADTFEAVLDAAAFEATPLMSAKVFAGEWAEAQAATLITRVTRTTRQGIRELVARTIAEGESMRTLKNAIRSAHLFSRSRAETVARTEMATAVGEGQGVAARTQGRDEKRWRTARDERVDGGDASGPCIDAEREGWIGIDDSFANGRLTIPAHPRCRCDVEYRTREFVDVPRSVREPIERAGDGLV